MKKMMSFLTSKSAFLILILLIAVVGASYMSMYSSSKNMQVDKMTTRLMPRLVPGSKISADNSNGVAASGPLGRNEDFQKVNMGKGTAAGLPPSGNKNKPCNKPGDLLPKDEASQWASLNPAGKGDIGDINLLTPNQQVGLNTVGCSLRNANQQLRSDPCIKQVDTGPWLNSTICPDPYRLSFEIGNPSDCKNGNTI